MKSFSPGRRGIWGHCGNCWARAEVKNWESKEHPQRNEEEQSATEQCEGGVEWDEKDCWLKTARPNGWVDQGYSERVKTGFQPVWDQGRQDSSSLTVHPDRTMFTTSCSTLTACLYVACWGQHNPSSALAEVPGIPDSICHRTLESRATHLAPILQSDMFNLKGSVWHFGKYPWSLYDKRIRWHDRHHSFLCYISVNIRLRPAAG